MAFAVVNTLLSSPYSSISGLQNLQCRVKCTAGAVLAGQPVYVCSVKCGYSTISEGE